MCWIVAGGDGVRYEQLLLGTDLCTVFSAFLSWCNYGGHPVITMPEKSRRLAAARALMGRAEPKFI
jgi:hypothetical protein